MTTYPEYLKYYPLDGQCQPYYDALQGSETFSALCEWKDVYVIEYGQVIAVNPKLNVSIEKLFDKEFTKDKTLMGRMIYSVRETDECVRVIVYDRMTMRDGRMFAVHDFSVLLLPMAPYDAEELVDSFDKDAYRQYVREFRKKYADIVLPAKKNISEKILSVLGIK